jgi:hypothetical protein
MERGTLHRHEIVALVVALSSGSTGRFSTTAINAATILWYTVPSGCNFCYFGTLLA